jgi:autotransporter-associated beta strand protein
VDIPDEPLTLGGATPAALHKGGAGATALGGTVTLVADTAIAIDGGSTLNLTNPAGISGAGLNLTLDSGAGAQGSVSGPITLGAGSVTKTGGGTWTFGSLANNYSGQTFFNGGSLVVGALAALGSAPAAFNPAQFSFNTGTLATVSNSNISISDGLRGLTVLDTASAGFNVGAGGTLTIGNTISGSGITVTKSGSGTLVLNGANTFDGTLNIDSASTTVSDGILRLASPGALGSIFTIGIRNNNAGTSTLQLDGSSGALTVSPTLIWAGRNNNVPAIENVSGDNTLSPTFVAWNVGGSVYPIESASGTLTLNGTFPGGTAPGFRSLRLAGAGNMLVNANIQDGLDLTNLSFVVATNSLLKDGTGTVTLTAANFYSGWTVISNGTLLVNGFISGSGITNVGGVLGGSGSTFASVWINPGATLAPGESIGTFTVNGDLTIAGDLAVEVSQGSGNDMTSVSGALVNTGSGTVQVSNLGAPLAVGNSFTLFDKPLQNGNAMSVTGAGVVWTNNLALNGSINVVSLVVPRPVISTVSVSGGNVVFNGSNAPASGNYVVLSSTNVAAPLANWTREITNAWPGTANFSITNPVVPGSPQRFYLLQSQ